MSDELITSIGFDAVLQARNEIASHVEHAHQLLARAQEIATAHGLGVVLARNGCFHLPMKDFLRPEGAALAMRITDAEAWKHLFERSHILDLMGASQKERWRKDLETGSAPTFQESSIRGTFEAIYTDKEVIFEESVAECFAQLHTGYATNQVAKFGKKIIVSHVLNPDSGVPGQNACDQVDDLLRFLTVVDGKPAPHANQVRSFVLSAHIAGRPKDFECDYFLLRCYKNGNGHLSFKRLDLVDRLNEVLAKRRARALPSAR